MSEDLGLCYLLGILTGIAFKVTIDFILSMVSDESQD